MNYLDAFADSQLAQQDFIQQSEATRGLSRGILTELRNFIASQQQFVRQCLYEGLHLKNTPFAGTEIIKGTFRAAPDHRSIIVEIIPDTFANQCALATRAPKSSPAFRQHPTYKKYQRMYGNTDRPLVEVRETQIDRLS